MVHHVTLSHAWSRLCVERKKEQRANLQAPRGLNLRVGQSHPVSTGPAVSTGPHFRRLAATSAMASRARALEHRQRSRAA